MNVVSYSLWGDSELYYDGAFKNIDLVKEHYPEFVTRFYCSPSIPDKYHNKYTDNGAEVVVVEDGKDDWTGLFWRFYALEESGIVLIRDTDSRIIQREVNAVRSWIQTKFDFHCMRDHMEHTTTPILGGMFGARNGKVANIRGLIDAWVPKNKKGDDQEFLASQIWRQVQKDAVVHCRCAQKTKFTKAYTYDPIKFFGRHKIMPFPGDLTDDRFVGEIIEND